MGTVREGWSNRPIWGKAGIVTTLLGCITAIVGALAAIGMDLDRPVWAKGDLLPMQIQQVQIEQRVYSNSTKGLDREIGQKEMNLMYMMLERDKLIADGKTIQPWMMEKITKLRQDIEKLKAERDAANAEYNKAVSKEQQLIQGF